MSTASDDQDARVALGGVGTKPWRSREAEARARRPAPAHAETFAPPPRPRSPARRRRPDNAFKVELAKRTLVRALETAR